MSSILTIFYTFWSCVVIKLFWNDVLYNNPKIMGYQLPLNHNFLYVLLKNNSLTCVFMICVNATIAKEIITRNMDFLDTSDV